MHLHFNMLYHKGEIQCDPSDIRTQHNLKDATITIYREILFYYEKRRVKKKFLTRVQSELD